MTTDINERIARLVEPEPKHSKLNAFVSESGCWVWAPYSGQHWAASRNLTESIDYLLEAIERRWPGAVVRIETAQPLSPFALASIQSADKSRILGDATMVDRHSDVNGGAAVPHNAAHALALALLAALEAERG